MTSEKQKKHAFIHIIGETAANVFFTREEDADDSKSFDDVVRSLTAYFMPMKNIEYAMFKLNGMVQGELVGMDDYVVRLRRQCELCEFGSRDDQEIKRQILIGCNSTELRKEMIKRPGISVAEILTAARMNEASKAQTKTMEARLHNQPTSTVAVMQHQSGDRRQSDRQHQPKLKSNKRPDKTPSSKQTSGKKSLLCFFCGQACSHPQN